MTFTKSEKLQRAGGSVYDIKISMHWKRSSSKIQTVVETFLELVSNMYKINLQDLLMNRFILSNQNLVQL